MQPAPAPKARNGRQEIPSHARVLVVDDHQDTRDLLFVILKTEGYDVALAADGDEALAAYREHAADVVILDMFMPRKDGVTTIRELRTEFAGVTIVAMSGDANAWHDALVEARTAGAQLTLRKPLEPWVLLRALEGLLAGRRALTTANGLHRSA
jgi:two-component system NtrC family response regulator/two-component system response regulator HydG